MTAAAAAMAAAAGERVRRVVIAGGGAPLAAGLATEGYEISFAARAGELPAGDWDIAFGWFDVTFEADPRSVAAGLRRAAAAVVLASYTPAAMARARGRRPAPRGHRPEAWSRYETAYRHFFDAPGLDVREVGPDVTLVVVPPA